MQAIAADPAHTVQQITRATIEGAVHIPLALIKASPTNPRKHFDVKKLEELASSIGKHGLMQPIMVRPIDNAPAGAPLYELIAGERRWRASGMAGATSIMALVRPMPDLEVLELQLIENLQRDDLHPLEEADGYQQLLRKPQGLQGYATLAELAARIGRSESYVRQRVQLLRLCPEARTAVLNGSIGVRAAIEVARLANHADQVTALAEIKEGWGGEPMTFLQATAYIQRTFHLALDKAIFATGDSALVFSAGSCTNCPKRTGANPDLFEDIKKADTCTDPACYRSKEEAHRTLLKNTAEAEGKTVITGAAAKKAVPHQYGQMKGYLELDKVHYELGTKPLRKLLGKEPFETKLLEHPHTKALIEVVAEAEAVAILKAVGVLKQARMPSGTEAQRDADRKAKAETIWRNTAAAECVRVAGTNAGAEAAYRMELLTQVALVLWARLSNDDEKRVEKLMGWEHIGSQYADKANAGRTEARIRSLSDGQLCQLFTACSLAGELHVNSLLPSSKPERLLSLAQHLSVDAAAIREDLRREQLARVPVKTATAKSKGPTPETALAAALKNAKPVKQSKVVVKYRNAATGETWSGRGLQPMWLKTRLADGAKLDDYLVDKPAPAAAPAPYRSELGQRPGGAAAA